MDGATVHDCSFGWLPGSTVSVRGPRAHWAGPLRSRRMCPPCGVPSLRGQTATRAGRGADGWRGCPQAAVARWGGRLRSIAGSQSISPSGGSGSYCIPSCVELGDVVAEETLDEVDSAVDPGGDPGSRAGTCRLRPSGPGRRPHRGSPARPCTPSGCRTPALQEPGGRQDDGSGAHRHDDLGVCASFGDVVDERLVARGSQRRGHPRQVQRSRTGTSRRRRCGSGRARRRSRSGPGRGLADDHHLVGGVDPWDRRQAWSGPTRSRGVNPGYRTIAICLVDGSGMVLLPRRVRWRLPGCGHGRADQRTLSRSCCPACALPAPAYGSSPLERSTGRPCSTQSSLPPGYTATLV